MKKSNFLYCVVILLVVGFIGFNESCFADTYEKANSAKYAQEIITVLQKRFDNDWSNFDAAYDLFNAYLTDENNDANKYSKAAILLFDYYNQALNEKMDKPIDVEKLNNLKIIYAKYKKQANQNIQKADSLAIMSGISLLFSAKENSYNFAQQAYSLSPKKYASLFSAANMLKGNNFEAYRLINEAINYNFADYEAYLRKAEICMNLKKYQEAIAACDYLISQNKLTLNAISLAYYCLVQTNANDSKILSVLAPQYFDLSYSEVYIKLVEMLLLNSGHVGTAKSMAKRAIALEPQNIDVYIRLGNIYKKVGLKKESSEMASKVMELSSK